eukprot:9844123-Heterocapsa_arctica.AAC.1
MRTRRHPSNPFALGTSRNTERALPATKQLVKTVYRRRLKYCSRGVQRSSSMSLSAIRSIAS